MIGRFSTNSFIAGIMVGVLLTGVWFLRGDLTITPKMPSSSATSTTTGIQKSGRISIANQPSGGTVIVESVTVPPPGVWVAVREINGGDLGNILGATRVNGPRRDVPVPLLRATESGRPYAVQLYRDDANGIFDIGVNSAYVDFDTGARAVAYFTTVE